MHQLIALDIIEPLICAKYATLIPEGAPYALRVSLSKYNHKVYIRSTVICYHLVGV